MANFKEAVLSRGYGMYQEIDTNLLPKLWMAYVRKSKESGKVHSDIKTRFERGDTIVAQAMADFGDLAVRARQALLQRDRVTLAYLIDANFDLRLQLYGKAVVGPDNLAMVSIARKAGHAAKQSGSGGCVIGLYAQSDTTQMESRTIAMRNTLERQGYVFSYLNF